MKKRILSLLLAASVAFFVIGDCTPKAKAIVPVGIVQSALASYISSTGYKLYNDQGTGQQLLGSLSDLYDTWLDSSAGQALSQWTLTHIAAIDAVYLDRNNNFVLKRSVVEAWQSFADWIETNYNIPKTNVPTQVISASGGNVSFPSYATDGTYTVTSLLDPVSVYHYLVSLMSKQMIVEDTPANAITNFFQNNSGKVFLFELLNPNPSDAVSSDAVISIIAYPAVVNDTITLNNSVRVSKLKCPGYARSDTAITVYDATVDNSVRSTAWVGLNASPGGFIRASTVNTVSQPASGGLAVSLGGDVVDYINDIAADHAMVIDVGATAGTTPAELADIVATGAKANTLDPAVSVVAEDVIDTPAQPYPDVDSLGLPSLGAALVSRFPFCIPWDFADIVGLLSADPEPPNIRIDLFTSGFKSKVGITGDTSFSLDLGTQQYSKIGVFCRWGSLISFLFFLALLTKRMVWTA